jgi:hypothetical protein
MRDKINELINSKLPEHPEILMYNGTSPKVT